MDILFPKRIQVESRASERRVPMGLFTRGQTWWMRFTYKGKQIRKSTETDDKSLQWGFTRRWWGRWRKGNGWEVTRRGKDLSRTWWKSWKTEYFSKLRSFSPAGATQRVGSISSGLRCSGNFPSLIMTSKPNEGTKRKNLRPLSATRYHEEGIQFGYSGMGMVWQESCRKGFPEKLITQARQMVDIQEEENLLSTCPIWWDELVLFGLNTGMRSGKFSLFTWKGLTISENGDRI